MKEEVAKELAQRFPGLFAAKGASPWTERGWETPPGWTGLLVEMCKKLDALVSPYYGTDEAFQFGQIKSKFAELRVYVDHAPEAVSKEVNAVIEEACARSRQTCESTGLPGRRVQVGGWLSVLNHDAADKLRNEQNAEALAHILPQMPKLLGCANVVARTQAVDLHNLGRVAQLLACILLPQLAEDEDASALVGSRSTGITVEVGSDGLYRRLGFHLTRHELLMALRELVGVADFIAVSPPGLRAELGALLDRRRSDPPQPAPAG